MSSLPFPGPPHILFYHELLFYCQLLIQPLKYRTRTIMRISRTNHLSSSINSKRRLLSLKAHKPDTEISMKSISSANAIYDKAAPTSK